MDAQGAGLKNEYQPRPREALEPPFTIGRNGIRTTPVDVTVHSSDLDGSTGLDVGNDPTKSAADQINLHVSDALFAVLPMEYLVSQLGDLGRPGPCLVQKWVSACADLIITPRMGPCRAGVGVAAAAQKVTRSRWSASGSQHVVSWTCWLES